MTDHRCSVFRFGDIEISEREFRLVKAGETRPVEPKAFRVLLFLLRNRGRLVTKDEIVDAVWNDCAVSDNSLARSIATLRRLLGDDSHVPRYIETVPTIGYRFLRPVQVIDDREAAVTAPQTHGSVRSLAVLPFANGTGPPEAEYLSEGISESIINLLSQFPDLRVVPRATAFQYKGHERDLKKIGSDLKVEAVLTGTVTHIGESLIVQAELVDVVNDDQLWGNHYNRKIEDIFDLQEELARRISESLLPRLTLAEEKLLSRRPTENREAYHLYLKAMYYANKWTPEGVQMGVLFSRQAIEMDPLFATAYAGLAYLYVLVSSFSSLPPRQAFPLAKAAALRALEIDDSLAYAHASLAFILLAYEWDWENAEKESRRAIELAPQLPGCHYVRSQWCVVMGLSEEAVAEARTALELDPLSLSNYMNLAIIYQLLREHDLVIEYCKRALELDPSFASARQVLAVSYAYKGRYPEAFEEAERATAFAGEGVPVDIRAKGVWGTINAMAGKHDEARNALVELMQYSGPPEFRSASDCAYIHALLGETNEAIEYLEKAYQGGHTSALLYIKLRPLFDWIRTDPRFIDLVHRVGFPD